MSIIRQLARVANRIDSASIGTFLSKGDSTGDFTLVNYTDLSGRPTTLDSAALTSIVDSAYIQLRQTSAGSGGLDSAVITAIVDSNYVVARSPAASSGFANYEYTATAGQTTFQDSDINGNVMSYTADGIFVFYNGVLIAPTTDYTATDGSSVVLTTGADSGSHVAISKWNIASAGGAAGIAWGGDRGVSAGGWVSSNTIEYFDITTPGNATDFGDLTVSRSGASDASNSTIGLFMGGYANPTTNTIDYITFATTSNASDFGDLTEVVSLSAGVSDGTYGVKMGGYNFATTNYSNVIDYVTIASPSNSTDFGDLSSTRRYAAGANDSTRGLLAGGETTGASYVNSIEYITIASPSNSTDFGDLSANSYYSSGTADATYSVICLGYTPSAYTNAMEYVTTQTTSNSSDFGDLNVTKAEFAATSNGTYGVFAGGDLVGQPDTTAIEYITIATPSNATDFGDLITGVYRNAGSSGSPS